MCTLEVTRAEALPVPEMLPQQGPTRLKDKSVAEWGSVAMLGNCRGQAELPGGGPEPRSTWGCHVLPAVLPVLRLGLSIRSPGRWQSFVHMPGVD